MTKVEGIRRLRAGERFMHRSIIAGLTFLGLSVLGSAAATSHEAQEILVAIGVTSMLACFFVAGIAKSRVRCVKCGRRLQDVPAQIAVATGHCGYCGEEAFDNESLENGSHNG